MDLQITKQQTEEESTFVSSLNNSLGMSSYTSYAKERGPHVLISAGVHGDEYEPMLAASRLTERIDSVLIKGSVTIVPVVNQSAFKLNSRCAEDGLDLARICPGIPGGTVSERTAWQISSLIKKADYYIDLHTGGRLFDIYPLAGYMLHDSAVVLNSQQQMAKAFGLPVIWGTDGTPDGRTLSVARDAHIPAIYIEYGGGSSVRREIVQAFLNGCMRMLSMLNLVREKLPEAPEFVYWVEDDTPDAGHLQSKMKSSAEGLFVPEVEIGNIVFKGQLWGNIINLAGGSHAGIYADIAGFVIFIRTQAYVCTGDALGGILPITEPGKKNIHGS